MTTAERLAAEIHVLDRRLEALEAELIRAHQAHRGPLEPGKVGRFEVARRPEEVQRELDLLTQEWLDLHDQLTREWEALDDEAGLRWGRDEVD